MREHGRPRVDTHDSSGERLERRCGAASTAADIERARNATGESEVVTDLGKYSRVHGRPCECVAGSLRGSLQCSWPVMASTCLVGELAQTLDRRPQRPLSFAHIGPQVAYLRHTIGHVAERECLWFDRAAFDLFPRAGSGHRRPSLGADSIRGGERRAVAVSACVDEDASTTVGLAEFLVSCWGRA